MIRLVRKDTPCHGIKVPSAVQSSEPLTLGVSTMNSSVFGIDIAKQVFQIHWVDQETGVIHSEEVKQKKSTPSFLVTRMMLWMPVRFGRQFNNQE